MYECALFHLIWDYIIVKFSMVMRNRLYFICRYDFLIRTYMEKLSILSEAIKRRGDLSFDEAHHYRVNLNSTKVKLLLFTYNRGF